MVNVVLLGAGNVATHIYRAFSTSANIQVRQVYNRSRTNLAPFESSTAVTTSLEDLMEADIYLLALKDDVIPEVTMKLKHKTGLIAHTSGAVPLEAMKGPARTGVFYPLQTFSKELQVNYQEIPFCLETKDPEDLVLLKQIAMEISGKAYEIDSSQRKKFHLAAVFVCNFVNHLYAVGEDICVKNDMPFEILQPLIQETAKKIKVSSPKEVQTGPAKRRDETTIQAHLDLITNEEDKAIYQLLTNAIQTFHGKKL